MSAIRSHGTLDGYNTESPERLHIEFAKLAYRATNKRDFTIQMARWLDWQDTMCRYEGYLAWLNLVEADGHNGGRKKDEVDSEDEEEGDEQKRKRKNH